MSNRKRSNESSSDDEENDKKSNKNKENGEPSTETSVDNYIKIGDEKIKVDIIDYKVTAFDNSKIKTKGEFVIMHKKRFELGQKEIEIIQNQNRKLNNIVTQSQIYINTIDDLNKCFKEESELSETLLSCLNKENKIQEKTIKKQELKIRHLKLAAKLMIERIEKANEIIDKYKN